MCDTYAHTDKHTCTEETYFVSFFSNLVRKKKSDLYLPGYMFPSEFREPILHARSDFEQCKRFITSPLVIIINSGCFCQFGSVSLINAQIHRDQAVLPIYLFMDDVLLGCRWLVQRLQEMGRRLLQMMVVVVVVRRVEIEGREIQRSERRRRRRG